jgi:uncharacterized membrane-anchored protein
MDGETRLSSGGIVRKIVMASCRMITAAIVVAVASPVRATDLAQSPPAAATSPVPAKDPAAKDASAQGNGDATAKTKKKARRDPGKNQPGPAGNVGSKPGPTPGPAGNAGPGR